MGLCNKIGGESTENVTGNTINITGGTINGEIRLGLVQGGTASGSVTDNVINIYGNPNLTSAYIAAYAGDVSTYSGNVLNFYTKDITMQGIGGLDTLNFYLGSEITNNDTMLTLTDTNTNFSNMAINAILQGDSTLTVNDYVTLITNSNGITTDDSTTYSGTLAEGVSLAYDLKVYLSDTGNSIVLGIFGEDESSASNNNVSVFDIATGYIINGNHYFSDSDTGVINIYGGKNNNSDISDGDILGGYDSSGVASNNNVSISGGNVSGNIYGGYAESDDEEVVPAAEGNKVDIISGTVNGNIYGGYSDIGNAGGNAVNIYGGTIGGNIYGSYSNSAGDVSSNTILISSGIFGEASNIYGGYSESGSIHDNEIVIGEDVNTSLFGIIGGRSTSGDVYNNTITVNSSDINISGNISGGQSDSGKVYNNTININGGNINSVGGADVDTGESYGNVINIYGGTLGNVYGGLSSNGTSHNETVNIFGGTITGMIDGGDYNSTVNFSDGTFTDSMIRGSRYGYGGTINITGGTFSGSIFGTINDEGNAYNNTINISNATYNVDDNGIFGAQGLNAYDNVVNIYSGNFSTGSHPSLIIGGASIADNGIVHDNTVNIEGGTFSGNIIAGSGNSEVYNNILNIRGGTFASGYLAGGAGENVHDNTINIYGTPDLSGVELRGSYPDAGTNNTLNIYTKNLTAKNIYNFNTINFYPDENVSSGDTLLTFTNDDNFEITDIIATLSGTHWNKGDTITLLKKASSFEAKSYTADWAEDSSLTYGLNIYKNTAGDSLLLKLVGASDNNIVVNGTNYTINNENFNYSSDVGLLNIFGGSTNAIPDTESDTGLANVVGGWDSSGVASNNTIQINGGAISGNVYGGYATGNVIGNKLDITGGSFGGSVYGGYSESGNASNNSVEINDGTFGIIVGGYGLGDDVNGNTVTINGGTVSSMIVGGFGNGNVTGNSINIYNNPNLNNAALFGWSNNNSTHSDNALNIYTKNLTAKNIYNFDTVNFYLNENISNSDTILTLTDSNATDLSNTDITATVQGNSSLSGGDSVTLLTNENGLSAVKSTTAQLAEGVSLIYDININRNDTSLLFEVASPVDDSNNTVNITASSTSDIYGGYTNTGNAQNNTVNLQGGTSFANIYGGYAPNGLTSGNTLNIYAKDMTAQNLYNFDAMNFYLGSNITNGDTILTLTDSNSTDLTNTDINAVVQGGSNLDIGDSITLLTNSNGVTAAKSYNGTFEEESESSNQNTNNKAKFYKTTLTEGVSLTYDLNVYRNDAGDSIIAEITSDSPVDPIIEETSASNNTVTINSSTYKINDDDAVSINSDTGIANVYGGKTTSEDISDVAA